MGFLPNLASLTAAVGSQLNVTYVLHNDDDTLMNITNKTFEFSIRTDPGQLSATPPLVSVNSTASTASGTIAVTTNTSTVAVSVSAAAMNTLTQRQYFYTLWMDQGQNDATAMVSGVLFVQFTSVP
jgi:hypothetical protein